jgi:hypothetical protein
VDEDAGALGQATLITDVVRLKDMNFKISKSQNLQKVPFQNFKHFF